MPVRVLVVDDEADIRAMIRFALEEEGYVVVEAGDGDATLHHLAASPVPSVVLLDLMIPKRDGEEILQAIALDPLLAQHAYILMTASYRLSPSLQTMIERLGVPVVLKPFEISELLAIVRQMASTLFPLGQDISDQLGGPGALAG